MKRFLGFFFIAISLLSYGVSHSQTKTDTSGEPNTMPSSSEQQNRAVRTPQQHQEQTTVEDRVTVGGKDSPVKNSSNELAKKDFVAIAISIFATGIAFVSWLASRDAIRVTKDIGSAQLRAYLTIRAIEGTLGGASYSSKKVVTVSVFNTGQTPARILSVKHRWVRLTNSGIDDLPQPQTFYKDHISHDWAKTEISQSGIARDETLVCIVKIPKNIQMSFGTSGFMDTFLDFVVVYSDIYGTIYVREHLLRSIRLKTPEECHAIERQVKK